MTLESIKRSLGLAYTWFVALSASYVIYDENREKGTHCYTRSSENVSHQSLMPNNVMPPTPLRIGTADISVNRLPLSNNKLTRFCYIWHCVDNRRCFELDCSGIVAVACIMVSSIMFYNLLQNKITCNIVMTYFVTNDQC